MKSCCDCSVCRFCWRTGQRHTALLLHIVNNTEVYFVLEGAWHCISEHMLQNLSQLLLDESTDIAYMIYMSQIIFALSDLFHELFVFNTYLLLCISLSLHVRVRFILLRDTVVVVL